eukprot:5606491-Amphidinium_carterae.1
MCIRDSPYTLVSRAYAGRDLGSPHGGQGAGFQERPADARVCDLATDTHLTCVVLKRLGLVLRTVAADAAPPEELKAGRFRGFAVSNSLAMASARTSVLLRSSDLKLAISEEQG